MTLTDEKIQAILDGAPDGERYCNVPILRGLDVAIHKLTDLREILELRQEVGQQQQRIAELEATVERLRLVCEGHGILHKINHLLEGIDAKPEKSNLRKLDMLSGKTGK